MSISFLKPVGGTFSHVAYNVLAQAFRAPDAITVPGKENCVPANTNGEVLGLVLGHGGFGAIAMETLEGGRVAEPLESFIHLLGTYKSTAACPVRIPGAIRMRIRFCLMARPGVEISSVSRIVAHPKAFGPCKGRIASLGLPTENASSNGEAARLIAEDATYASSAALGPRCAAEKYGLSIIHDSFEDDVAITTFFLLAPASYPVSKGKENRMLIVFNVPHEPGAIIKALEPFALEELNLIQIHSMHVGKGTYHFAIEIEVGEHQLPGADRAMESFKEYVGEHIAFGPFPVLSR